MRIDLRSATALAPFLRLSRNRAEARPKAEENPKAEGEEDPKAEGDDPKAEDDPNAKAEGGDDHKAAEGEGDPEAEDDEEVDPAMQTKAARAIRAQERKRIAGILGHKNAAANPGIAMNLALETDLSVKAAHAVLDGGQTAGKTGLADRMNAMNTPRPGPGGGPAPGGSAAIQAGWAKAYEKLGAPSR